MLTGEAVRTLQRIPPRIVEPLLAFIFSGLAENPTTRGKPLVGDFEGYWTARRGDFRVIYRIDDTERMITVHRVAGRADAYRPR
jgi:mRNA interferase RelE/StbE